jgi:hypothetical protein
MANLLNSVALRKSNVSFTLRCDDLFRNESFPDHADLLCQIQTVSKDALFIWINLWGQASQGCV